MEHQAEEEEVTEEEEEQEEEIIQLLHRGEVHAVPYTQVRSFRTRYPSATFLTPIHRVSQPLQLKLPYQSAYSNIAGTAGSNTATGRNISLGENVPQEQEIPRSQNQDSDEESDSEDSEDSWESYWPPSPPSSDDEYEEEDELASNADDECNGQDTHAIEHAVQPAVEPKETPLQVRGLRFMFQEKCR
jgi:hypothetical protein